MSDRPKNPRKRLYVFDSDDGWESVRFAVVHTSLKEAKKWLWSDMDVQDCCYNEYIRFKPYWLKGVDVSDLSVGDDLISITGIERGIYEWIDGEVCPECGETGKIEFNEDWLKICCSDCDDKFTDEWIAQTGGGGD